MNRSLVFFFFPVLAAGAFIGHTGKDLFRPSTEFDARSSSEKGVLSHPRFGDARSDGPLTALRRDAARPVPIRMALDDSLQRYVRMGTEELCAELEKCGRQDAIGVGVYAENTELRILLSYICKRLGEEAPLQTLAYLKDRKKLGSYMAPVLEAWARKNPEAAMVYCRERMDEGSDRKSLWSDKYVALLSDKSPEEALDYLLTCSPEERNNQMFSPLSRFAEKNPEKLPELLERLKPSMKRDIHMDRSIARLLAKSDWKAAEQWIMTAPEEKRGEILVGVVASLPRGDALEKLKTLDEKAKISVLEKLGANIFFNESPVESLEFLQENMTEDQAVKVLEKSWYLSPNVQEAELSSYLDKMPQGAFKDSILEKVYNNSETRFYGWKTEDTLALINQMSSDEKRLQVLGQWVHEDPQAVRSWAEQSSLAEDEKKEFIRQCDEALKRERDDE